jgi:hypothetical protein
MSVMAILSSTTKQLEQLQGSKDCNNRKQHHREKVDEAESAKR